MDTNVFRGYFGYFPLCNVHIEWLLFLAGGVVIPRSMKLDLTYCDGSGGRNGAKQMGLRYSLNFSKSNGFFNFFGDTL